MAEGRRGRPTEPSEQSAPLTGPFLRTRLNLKAPLGLAAGPSRNKGACLELIPGSPREAGVPVSLLVSEGPSPRKDSGKALTPLGC